MKPSTEAEKQYQKDNRAKIEDGTHIPNPHPKATGPLSVYCESRWAVLQREGFTWAHDLGLAIKPAGLGKMMVAERLPGDPGMR